MEVRFVGNRNGSLFPKADLGAILLAETLPARSTKADR